MTRAPRPAQPIARGMLALALLLGLTGLLGAAAPAEPVYSSTPATTPADDEGTILIPEADFVRGNFYLAISEAARGSADAQAIWAALDPELGQQDAKILLGVDREPNNLSGAAQLVRGLLLFGDTDALADDWLEHGKERGYVGDGWIVIGVMLPEESGGKVGVHVETGRDVTGTSAGAVDSVEAAGADSFAAGDYNTGISQVARAAATQLQAPPDRTLFMAITLGVLALLVAAGISIAVRARLRRIARQRAQESAERAEALEQRTRREFGKLRRRTITQLPAAASSRSGRLFARLEELRQNELKAGMGQPGPQRYRQLSGLNSALELAQHFSAGGPAQREAWNRIFEDLRARSEQLALFLDQPGASQLDCAGPARRAIIEATDRAEQLRARLPQAQRGGEQALHLLDKLWELRDELASLQADAVSQARVARVKLPKELAASLAASPAGTQPTKDEDPEALALLAAYETTNGR